MEVDNSRRDFLRDMVDRLVDSLTEAAVARFGDEARRLAKSAHVIPMPNELDFVEVLLSRAVPWSQTMMGAFGREPVADLIAECLAQPMREFGQRSAATSDGSIAGRIERALAPIPPDALTIEDRAITNDGMEFKVTRCRYAELLTKLGAEDLGSILICNHDFAVAEGMGLTLKRSTTLMRDRRPCDFRYMSASDTPDD